MTDNEKAAIAAGLWTLGQICVGCPPAITTYGRRLIDHRPHALPAPDMHDPANLWRALENRKLNVMWAVDKVIAMDSRAEVAIAKRTTATDAVFAALVALYDAEHKDADRKAAL